MPHDRIFICSNCGARYIRWQGQCEQCGEWNTIKEQQIPESGTSFSSKPGRLKPLTEKEVKARRRVSTGYRELDRVLGGGLVAGSVVLIGGPPGIGKSTLLLQVAHKVASQQGKVLYVSGEESSAQIALRAKRLGAFSDSVMLLTEPRLEQFRAEFSSAPFSLVVIDSIQSVYLASESGVIGGVSQVRQSASLLSDLCKNSNTPLFLIGHITKEGSIAGPKTLEHLVDVVLYFEEDTGSDFRLLKAFKNRFGVIGEVGVFKMTSKGLEDVDDPSSLFVSTGAENQAGSVVTVGLEGKRPFLLELQALVSKTSYSYPQRVIRGLDLTRSMLLLAILEKKVGIPLSRYDCFVNIVGGLRSDDPSLDLAFVLAVVSSFRNIPLKPHTVPLGELGLSGNLVAPGNLEMRLRELKRTSYNRVLVPAGVKTGMIKGLDIIKISHLFDAFNEALKKNTGR